MRKRLVLILPLLLLLAGCRMPAQTTAAASRDLADPESRWWASLQQAADGPARFAKAPVYQLDLTYAPDQRVLTGTEEVRYTNQTGTPLDKLYLITNARAWGDFALTDLKVNGKAAAHTQEERYATVPLSEPLRPGQTAVLTFGFRAQIPLAKPSPNTMDPKLAPAHYGSNPAIADGLSEALPAVRGDISAFKSFLTGGPPEDPIPSLWELQIVLPEGWHVISSGVAVTTEGQKTRVVASGNEFTLFAASKLGKVSQQVGGVNVIVHYPSAEEQNGKALLAAAARLLPVHEQSLGLFPFKEIEIMPIDSGGGYQGMSRTGVIALNQELYRTRVTEAPAAVTDPYLRRAMRVDNEEFRVAVLAHELAHAWWGDLARPDSFRGPLWLEGMTEASAIAALEKAIGAEAAEARRERNIWAYRRNRARGLPDMATGQPLRSAAEAPAALTMSYAKPALFYDRVRKQVGDEAYFGALRRYIEKGRFLSRGDRGPVEELMKQPGVADLYQRWMMETHGDEDLGTLTPEQRKQIE